MKILVTGGTGYIGSHTVVELQESGYEVIIIDNLSNSYKSVVDKIERITGIRPGFEEFDLTDIHKTLAFFKRHNNIQGVIHFAASKAVGESMEKPLMYYHNNLQSLVNVLKGMIENHIQNIVFSSSCTVYGQPDELPVTELAPMKEAWSPYGHTKQICESILQNTGKVSDINGILLRYFNPIGAHESALIGELPIGVPNNLVPFITQTAIGIREKLRVFGSDYNTPDGTAVRDYIHVVDLAKAHLASINRMAGGKSKSNIETFNIGTGNGFSVMEVIKSFEKVSKTKLKYEVVERRPGDIEQVWANTEYANSELGWKAEKSIDDMMDSAWKWENSLKGND